MQRIHRLCEYFRGLTDAECKKTAKALTSVISQALYFDEAYISIPEDYRGTELEEILSDLKYRQ